MNIAKISLFTQTPCAKIAANKHNGLSLQTEPVSDSFNLSFKGNDIKSDLKYSLQSLYENGKPRFDKSDIAKIVDNVETKEMADFYKKIASMKDEKGEYRLSWTVLPDLHYDIETKEQADLLLKYINLKNKNGKYIFNSGEIGNLASRLQNKEQIKMAERILEERNSVGAVTALISGVQTKEQADLRFEMVDKLSEIKNKSAEKLFDDSNIVHIASSIQTKEQADAKLKAVNKFLNEGYSELELVEIVNEINSIDDLKWFDEVF